MAAPPDDSLRSFECLRKALEDVRSSKYTRYLIEYEEYRVFAKQLKQLFDGRIEKMFLPGSGQLHIVDVTKSGELEILDLSSLDTGLDNTRSASGYVETAVSSLSSHGDKVQARAVWVSVRAGDLMRLSLMSILHRVYKINLPILWYVFRMKHRKGSYYRSAECEAGALLNIMQNRWALHHLLSFGPDSAIFIKQAKVDACMNIPTVILFLGSSRDTHRNALDGSPFASQPLRESGLASYLFGWSLTESAIYKRSQTAQKIEHMNSDNPYALFIALLDSTIHGNECKLYVSCVQFLLQYYIWCARAILTDHRADENHEQTGDFPAFVVEESDSWRLLERFLEQLQGQSNHLSRFFLTFKNVKASLEDELQELALLEAEVRTIVSHKRARLDHQLNESLLEESRANLQVANLAIKESQGTRLLTILAFIFVPWSLATSIYGMNLQELNESGKSIWTFIITGILLFLAACAAYVVAIMFSTAKDNFQQRRNKLDRLLDNYLPLNRPWIWSKLRKNPRIWTTLFSKQLMMGLLTGGRYDPKGLLYVSHLLVKQTDPRHRDIDPKAWEEGCFKREMTFLLGAKKLPEDEEYESIWKLRGESFPEGFYHLDFA